MNPRIVIQPMDRLGDTTGRMIVYATVHKGSAIVVLGTNGKPIGWIDTHAWIGSQVYRDQFVKPGTCPECKGKRTPNGTHYCLTCCGDGYIEGLPAAATA